MSLVDIDRTGPVAVLRLNRPEKLNALSTALEQALLRALDDPRVTGSGAVVLVGSGRAFSAGADTGELQTMDRSAILDYYRASGRVYEAVAGLRRPTVAAVHGYCLGGGFELALACDFRVAELGATFGFPEVALGILPSSGGTMRLARALGPLRARELVLLGRRYDAAQCERLGLVTEVVTAGTGLGRAVELAARLAELPADAVEVARLVLDAAGESSAAAGLLLERLGYAALAGSS